MKKGTIWFIGLLGLVGFIYLVFRGKARKGYVDLRQAEYESQRRSPARPATEEEWERSETYWGTLRASGLPEWVVAEQYLPI